MGCVHTVIEPTVVHSIPKHRKGCQGALSAHPCPWGSPPEASPHPLAPAFAIGVGVEGRLLSKEGAHSEMFLLLPSGLAPFFPVPQNKGVFSANLSPQRLNGSSGGSFMLWDGSVSKETEKRVYFPQG